MGPVEANGGASNSGALAKLGFVKLREAWGGTIVAEREREREIEARRLPQLFSLVMACQVIYGFE